MATNSLPATMDKTDGFYRKWLLVDFPNQFKEGKNPVYSVSDEEFCNLGRKCMSILKSLLESQNFANEGDIVERRARYEERSNPFDKFWDEFIEVDFISNITKNDFKNKLNGWLLERRHRAMSDVTINQRLTSKGIEETRVSMMVNNQEVRARSWAGLKWKINGSVHPVHPVHSVQVQKLYREGNSKWVDTLDTLDTDYLNKIKTNFSTPNEGIEEVEELEEVELQVEEGREVRLTE